MNHSSGPLADKSDEQLRGRARSCGVQLCILGVVATLYAVFLLYSAASGNWSWRMGLAVVPLLGMLLFAIVPMSRLAVTQQELARRKAGEKAR
jgi:hypothetical protein